MTEKCSCSCEDSVLRSMAAGFTRFQEQWYGQERGEEPPYASLLSGQEPKAMVIACSDSRVDPAIVLDANPGELFVVRNVANLVPPYEPDTHHHGVSAALEFGVRNLGIEEILIMGHARCGGFAGMLQRKDDEPSSFIDTWMDTVAEAVHRADAEREDQSLDVRLERSAQWGIRLSLDNLLTFPWIRSRVEAGRLTLHGLYFDLLTGGLLRFDPVQEQFVELVAGVYTETACLASE